MPRTALYIDNSFSFGGAINSLSQTLRHINKHTYKPVLITAQNFTLVKNKFPSIECHCITFKLPWIHNYFFKKVKRLPFVRTSTALKKALIYSRSLFWFFRHTIPETVLIYRLGKRCQARLVHLNNILGSQLPGILAAKMLRVPCVAHLRDYERSSRATQKYAEWIDHHIAISDSIRENLLTLGVPESRISVVHDAIDAQAYSADQDNARLIAEFGIREGEFLVGLFGRVIGWKGTREFVLAVERLSREARDIRAFVVGDASDFNDAYYRQVQSLAQSLGVLDKLVFTGYREDVAQLMHLMDVVVHSSITPEPFGMVIIEAMACGKPVIASNVGGGPLEIVDDGVTGFLVDPKDPEHTASALLKLLSDPDLRKEFGLAGQRKAIEQYDSKVQARQIEAIYDMVLAKQ